jgi:predicted dithiol-disulfide oxidoreductase (DUF899 family)
MPYDARGSDGEPQRPTFLCLRVVVVRRWRCNRKHRNKLDQNQKPVKQSVSNRKERKIMPKIKTVRGIENRKVVSQKAWLTARKKLLIEEKKFSKLRDRLNLQRRKLPWVKIEKNYVFDGPTGKVSFADLFRDKSQLVVYHFMFGPGWGDGCPHCSFWADHFDSVNFHIGRRDTVFAVVSRAPWKEIKPFKSRMGWKFDWFSSFETDFNFDFNVSFTPEQRKNGTAIYNYRPLAMDIDERECVLSRQR